MLDRMRRTLRAVTAPLLFALILSGVAAVIEAQTTSYRVSKATPQTITAHGTCAKVTNNHASNLDVFIPTQTAAEWQSFRDHPPAGVSLTSCATEIPISGTQSNANLCTLAGNPTTPGDYVFTIQAGAIVNSNSTAQPALTTGTCWPAGSTVTLINNGSIYGKGGNGGAAMIAYVANPGGAGGPALNLSFNLTIDNTNGIIFGGGGGGGAGGHGTNRGITNGCGGGGGGGQSGFTSNGGSGCSGSGSGGSGSIVGPGAGGNRNYCHGNGGAGGAWGTAGSNGAKPSGCTNDSYSGGPGGAAGKAIQLNGHAITWLGGNNANQVKGVIQ